MGRGQAVERDAAGVNYGASDPRDDGEAVPQGPPLFGLSGNWRQTAVVRQLQFVLIF